MKKIFLALTLLVSGFGFTDFFISTLHCNLTSDEKPVEVSHELTIRMDEKRKTMRVNLYPETKYTERRMIALGYKDISSWKIEFPWNNVFFEFTLLSDMTVLVSENFETESIYTRYACKII